MVQWRWFKQLSRNYRCNLFCFMYLRFSMRCKKMKLFDNGKWNGKDRKIDWKQISKEKKIANNRYFVI